MYLQSWQIFLLGAIFGVFIAVLAGVLIIFALAKRYGVNKVELRNAGESEDGTSAVDLVFKLTYIMYRLGLISENDMHFLTGELEEADWEKTLKKEESNENHR